MGFKSEGSSGHLLLPPPKHILLSFHLFLLEHFESFEMVLFICVSSALSSAPHPPSPSSGSNNVLESKSLPESQCLNAAQSPKGKVAASTTESSLPCVFTVASFFPSSLSSHKVVLRAIPQSHHDCLCFCRKDYRSLARAVPLPFCLMYKVREKKRGNTHLLCTLLPLKPHSMILEKR